MKRPLALRAALPLFLLAAAALAKDARAGGTEPGELANGGMFLDADTCSNCHGDGYNGDYTYLPFDTWAGTMMANATRDPIFHAALAAAEVEVPGSGTFCLRCHSTTSYVRGHATPGDGSALDTTDHQGVGCETCHRATQDPTNGGYLVGNAQLFYDDDHGKRGKYDDAISPNHAMVTEKGVLLSSFCGQCHEVESPTRAMRDAAGNDLGFPFALETTYSEYLASDYGKPGNALEATCQSCHMPKKPGMWPLTSQGNVLRTDPSEHSFVGANHWGITAVMAANPDRASLYPEAFANAQTRTLEMLAKAVTLTMTGVPGAANPGELFGVIIRVQNETGHKYPTGYVDGRRAWLALVWIDEDGNELPVFGDYDAATGEIQGETQVYYAEHGQWDGAQGVPVHSLVQADMTLVDTRIPPRGFVPDVRTAILGDISYDDGAGGTRSYDEVNTFVTVPESFSGAVKLEARVMHQTMTRAYVDHLATAGGAKGQALKGIYDANGQAAPLIAAKTFETMAVLPSNATASSTATVDPTGPSGVGGAGGGATGAGGSASTPPGDGGCGCSLAESQANESGPASRQVFSLAVIIGLLARRKRQGARLRA